VRRKLNLEEYPKELSKDVTKFLAVYLYWDEAQEVISEYEEKLQKELERKRGELEKSYEEYFWNSNQVEEDNNEDNNEEVVDYKEDLLAQKKEIYNSLGEKHKEYLSLNDLDKVSINWLNSYKLLSEQKLAYFYGYLEEDLTYYSDSEIKYFVNESLATIRKEFE